MSRDSSTETRNRMVRVNLALATSFPFTVSVATPPFPIPPPSYLKSTAMVCLPGVSGSLAAAVVGSDAPGLVAGEEMRRRAERRDHGLLRRNRDGVATMFEMFGKLGVG